MSAAGGPESQVDLNQHPFHAPSPSDLDLVAKSIRKETFLNLNHLEEPSVVPPQTGFVLDKRIAKEDCRPISPRSSALSRAPGPEEIPKSQASGLLDGLI